MFPAALSGLHAIGPGPGVPPFRLAGIVANAHLLGVIVGLGLIAQSVAETPGAAAERHYKEGLAHARQGKFDDALKSLESARRLVPNHPLVLNALGAVFTQKGDFAAAEKPLSQVLENDPSFEPARKNLAAGYFQQRRFDEAAVHWKKLESSAKAGPLARLFLGMIAAEQGRYEEAVAKLGGLAGIERQHPRAPLLLARAYSATGEKERVASQLLKIRNVRGLAPPDHVEAAILFSESKRHEDALHHLNIAARANPKPANIDYQRAVVLSRLDRNTEALDLLQGSEATKQSGRALNLLGQIAEDAGDLETAIQAMREAIALEPTVEDHYLDLSLLCVKHGNHELGEEILAIGLSEMPDSYRLLIQQGAIHERASKKQEAKQTFRRAIAAHPEHQLALAGLATTLLSAGETEQALEELRRGTERFPDDFYLHYLHGYALPASPASGEQEKADVQAKARESLERAIELNPDFADSYYRLGKILAETDEAKATENFEIALRLDPNDEAAKYQLARLYIKAGRRDEGRRLMAEVRQAKAEQLEKERKPRPGVSRASLPKL